MEKKELVKGIYEINTESGTKMVVGNKFNHLMQEINKRYGDQQIIGQTEEKGSLFQFWKKTYKIELAPLPKVEQKNQPKKKLEQEISAVIDFVKEEEDFFKQKFEKNVKETREQLEELTHTEKENEKIKELEELLRKKEVESEQTKKDMQEQFEKMLTTVISRVSPSESAGETPFLRTEKEGVLRSFYEKMIEREILEENAKKLIEDVKNQLTEEEWMKELVVEEALLEHIANEIKVTGKIDYDEEKVISFVGSTGVGKTTTIAKIGAYLQLVKGKKIGLITTDTFRIGAVKQLQIYAEYLQCPFYKAESREELQKAIRDLKFEHGVDIILIDTVGRNPLDDGLIDEIKSYLDVTNADHISLVLSSTMKTTDVKKIVKNFKKLGLTSLIFTKLDETINHGLILNVLMNERLRVSYITNGQEVPDDIHRASSLSLAKKVLNGVDEFESRDLSS